MKTNVLQLIGSFDTGGSERQAVQLVGLLQAAKDYKVFVACLNRKGVLRAEIERLGFADFPEYKLTSFYDANMFRQLKRAAKYLRENDIKIVQASDFYTNVFGMAAGALARTPVRIAAKRETGTKSGAQEFVERRAFDLAHAVVCNADAVKKHLLARGVSADKIHIVYNGLDLSRLAVSGGKNRVEILREFNLPTARNMRFVTIVANMRSKVKNHRMFLWAAQKVREKFESVAFVLAGEGELTESLKSFARELNIEKDVFFIGGAAKIGELLSVSDICVLSSKSEGFSNSILEYMSAAKPVVATRVGGAGEAIIDGETGFLIEPDDDETMAQRLLELLQNPEKAKRFGARGRRVVEEKFTLDAQLEKTLELYKSLLDKKASRPNL
jgi:glycosyltransferase involved in cell wall biosynthesis